MENLLEHLLYAEAKNCALLKEAAMDFVVKNKMGILDKAILKDVPPHLLTDMLAVVARGEGTGNTDEDAMRVNELRRRAHEQGLDMNGSRETLVATLKGI